METQPDEQPTAPEPHLDEEAAMPTPQENSGENGGGIGAGALATAGLGLIALAILIWFLLPLFGNSEQPATNEAPGTVIAELITTTPLPTPTTPVPMEVINESPTPIPPSPTPVLPTPTLPTKVEAGIYAKVVGTGTFGLRFRSGPGGDFVTWRILPEEEILKVTGGPEEADGVIWWRAVDKTGLVGWAAEQYLVPIEPPAWTPEPERTPILTEIVPTPTPEG